MNRLWIAALTMALAGTGMAAAARQAVAANILLLETGLRNTRSSVMPQNPPSRSATALGAELEIAFLHDGE